MPKTMLPRVGQPIWTAGAVGRCFLFVGSKEDSFLGDNAQELVSQKGVVL